jgi:Mitochondrial import receptor subunit Tom22
MGHGGRSHMHIVQRRCARWSATSEYTHQAMPQNPKLSARRSTGKAAWIASTTFLLLVAPLIVEMDREQQMVEFENQSLGALTGK